MLTSPALLSHALQAWPNWRLVAPVPRHGQDGKDQAYLSGGCVEKHSNGRYGRYTLQGTNISQNGILKMIFLFPRWDMLIPWRVEVFKSTNNLENLEKNRLENLGNKIIKEQNGILVVIVHNLLPWAGSYFHFGTFHTRLLPHDPGLHWDSLATMNVFIQCTDVAGLTTCHAHGKFTDRRRVTKPFWFQSLLDGESRWFDCLRLRSKGYNCTIGVIKWDPFWGNPPIQIHDNLEVFPL